MGEEYLKKNSFTFTQLINEAEYQILSKFEQNWILKSFLVGLIISRLISFSSF